MALKLVYSAAEKTETLNPDASPLTSSRKIFWYAFSFFFALKFPTIFLSYNPEELRDFEHFIFTSHGELPFRDFIWFYGALSPLVYGAALKILPATLLSMRLFTLLIWSLGSGIFSLLFYKETKNIFAIGLSMFMTTSMMGYPGYSNNHPLATVGLLISFYYWNEFYKSSSLKFLWASFIGFSVCFWTRPVLMGYGAGLVWIYLFLSQTKISRKEKIGFALKALLGSSLTLLFFSLLYGPRFKTSFVPVSWAILETKGYPNLHYLLPALNTFKKLDTAVKGIRAALETFVFYAHYFVWPTAITFLFSFFPAVERFRLAFTAMLFAVASSVDLLHYGFLDPTAEQAMRARGAFFLPLTFFSIALIVLPAMAQKLDKRKRRFAFVLFLILTTWGYTPWVLGLRDLTQFNTNPFQFKPLWGIKIHPDRIPLHSAISFINNRCQESDTVVVPQYEPGLSTLLKCKDLFQKDSYAFTRAHQYYVRKGETPYNNTTLPNSRLLLGRIAEVKPRYYLIQGTTPEILASGLAYFQNIHFGPENSTGRTVHYQP